MMLLRFDLVDVYSICNMPLEVPAYLLPHFFGVDNHMQPEQNPLTPSSDFSRDDIFPENGLEGT